MYDLPDEILSTLAKKESTNGDPTDGIITSPTTVNVASTATEKESVIGSKACSLCGVTFQTVEEQRGHIRSDLHGYNLKQRLRGAKPVNEETFEKLVGGI